jgi:hypothetical protein
MVNKLSFEKIIKAHFATMRDNSTNKVSYSDVFLFFGLPIFASGFFLSGYTLNKDILNSIITSASIFAGLLLNLLVLIYSLSEKFRQSNTSNWGSKQKVLEQTFSNISFCILISVLLVIACMLGFRTDDELKEAITIAKNVADFVIYYLTAALILHLLMVLKRIHLLMESEFPS